MLYHYTSIDSLVQIIKSQSLKLNNLTNCDDLEEAESADIEKAGKFIYVSCWTREAEESIPMWSQYSGNMHGVRIGMKEFPFQKRIYPNKYGESFESFMNVEKYATENMMTFSPDQPKLIDIEYTDDEAKLYPKVMHENKPGDKERMLMSQAGGLSFDFREIGLFKRSCWAFQKECRYKALGMPLGFKELEAIDSVQQMRANHAKVAKRILGEEYKGIYPAIFFDLSKDAIQNMEIIMGPRVTDSEEELLMAFLSSKGLSKNIKKSTLRIR